jgi:DNA repair protein RadC
MKEENAAYRITDLDEAERPRERLAALGSRSLSNAELLAIILRVGVVGENAVQVGHRLLTKYGGLTGLHRLSYQELCEEYGIGPAKAAQIKAAIELAHRFSLETPDPRPTVHSPADAAALVKHEMSVLEQEELWSVLMDTRNQVIKIDPVYRGSLNQAQVRVGELFKTAIRLNAASVIIVHNHPSGATRSM